ncbi:hypothetical protein HU200_055013 [Digitaria exilis]|uniref:Uncharacterized protein n=1 Tax=Digitaria exilis TaxID=1010633 RepID=A0A835E260_9POAL|nr:hypothetical protein HU200_055013 [Digitaria exilis]
MASPATLPELQSTPRCHSYFQVPFSHPLQLPSWLTIPRIPLALANDSVSTKLISAHFPSVSVFSVQACIHRLLRSGVGAGLSRTFQPVYAVESGEFKF